MGWSSEQLRSPSEHLGGVEQPAVSRLMHWAWLARELEQTFPLDSAEDRRRFLLWFLLRGRRRMKMRDGWINDFRNSSRRIDRAVYAIYNGLVSPLVPIEDALPASLRKRLLRGILDRIGRVVDIDSIRAAPESTLAPPSPATAGVTLTGYARAELGLGEYLRNSVSALQAVDMPLAVLDCSKIAPQRKRDDRLASLIRDDNPFPINVIHVTADQMFNACVSFPAAAIVGRYNIGAWMWELPRFPPEMLRYADFLDEIWAPTSFVRDALSESPIPVHQMPVCVSAEVRGTPHRARYGLAEGHFLFAFSFDVYSFLDRKNPAALIRAFQRAFPRGDERTGLVLKVMNADRKHPRWRELLAQIRSDPRITLITDTLDRQIWLDLMSLCDAYVSLHRSEGFGFGPAEAMCVGKPVILTGYGGVTDFARPDTALIVNHRLVPVQAGQYPFGEGQVWAEPDVEHAARHMRDLASDRDLARQIGQAGFEFMKRHHSPAVVGRAYRSRLQDILAARAHKRV